MARKFDRFLASVLCFVAVSGAIASTASAITYTYTGNNFATASAPYTTAMALNASFTFASALAPNLTDFDATSFVSVFTFSDGVQTYTESGAYLFAGFVVDTNALGDIVGWAADYVPTTGGSMATCSGTVTAAFGSTCFNYSPTAVDWANISAGPSGNLLNTPGSWVTVVPEPNEALLFMIGLTSLGWRARFGRS